MDDLRSEWQATRRLHILVYRFLLNFCTKNNLEEKLPKTVQSFITILKSVEEYNEFLVIKSMYNIGLLIGLFDNCASSEAFLFFKELKTKLFNQMKKLQELNQIYDKPKKLDNDESLEKMIELIKNIYVKDDKKKKKRKWSQGVVRTVKQKKKIKIQENKSITLETPSETPSTSTIITDDSIIISSDEEKIEEEKIEDKTEEPEKDIVQGIFNIDLSTYEKTQDTVCIQKLNQIYDHLIKTEDKPINNIFQKLNLTSSILDHSLDEINLIQIENILKTYNDIKYDMYLDQKSVPTIVHTKEILYSVGPLQVRCHEGDYAYYCTIETCKTWFVSKPIFLQRHIQENHSSLKCNWSCSNCSIILDYSINICDLEKAFDHLMNVHIYKKSKLFEKYQIKNDIYVYKNEEDTGLKIDNVVSLNPSFKNRMPYVPKLFLCPVKPCQFTTDEEISAFRHLNIKFGKFECYKCTYCDRFFTNAFSFCAHVFKDHRQDKYQCTECLYRSVSKNNVAYHQLDHHASNTVKVLLGNELKAQYNEEITIITLIPYKCTKKNCTFTTHILKNFTTHLSNCNTNILWLGCQNKICNFLTNTPDILLEHLANHGIGEYQCKYCPSAYFTKQAIRRHMYEIHPSKYPSIFQRVCYKTDTDKFKQYTKVESFNIDNEEIAFIDLDSCTADEICNSKVVTVEEYQNILNSYDCSMIDKELNDETDIVIDNIVLSDSETEETNENSVIENLFDLTPENTENNTESITNPELTPENDTVLKSMLSSSPTVNWSISTKIKQTPRPVVNGNNKISPIILKARVTSRSVLSNKQRQVARKSTTKNC